MAASACQLSVGVAARRLIVGSGARQLLIMLGMLKWRCEPPQARRSLGVRATARTTASKRARAMFSWVVSTGLREYLTVIAFADRSVPVRSKRSSQNTRITFCQNLALDRERLAGPTSATWLPDPFYLSPKLPSPLSSMRFRSSREGDLPGARCGRKIPRR